jgi:hypothetical protein
MTTRDARRAWAIRAAPGKGFIGYGWFGWNAPVHMAGNPICLFKTRREARVELPRIKNSWRRASVVRVVVTIETPRPARQGGG